MMARKMAGNMARGIVSLGTGAVLLMGAAGSALAAEALHAIDPPAQEWSFEGVFGSFDRASAQRGFQVYSQVCAACHTMEHLAYRHLEGIGFSEEEVKAIAATVQVTDGPDEFGDMFLRDGRPSDPFFQPFENEEQAKAANGGAFPPDLTLITKSRPGADYVHALLVGYQEAPAEIEVPVGLAYNPFFNGQLIAMPEPLFEDAVEYTDGTAATVDQMSRDVAMFMAWAAEPEMEERKRLGFKVIGFLIVLTGLLYASKRQLWSQLH